MPSNSKHAHNKARTIHTYTQNTDKNVHTWIHRHTHTYTYRCSWWLSPMEGSKVRQCQLNGVTTGEWFFISHEEAKTNIFLLSFCYPRDKVRMPEWQVLLGRRVRGQRYSVRRELSRGRGYLSLYLRSFPPSWRPSQVDLTASSPNFLSVCVSMERESWTIFTHMW